MLKICVTGKIKHVYSLRKSIFKNTIFITAVMHSNQMTGCVFEQLLVQKHMSYYSWVMCENSEKLYFSRATKFTGKIKWVISPTWNSLSMKRYKKEKKNNEKRQKYWKWEEWNSLWWVRYKSRMKIINTVKYQSMHSAREFGLSWVLHTWPKTCTYSRLSGVPDCPGPTMSVYSRGTAGTCCADGTHACGAPVSQLLPSPTSYSLSLTCPWFWFCSASNWPHQGATQNTCILSSPLSYMTPMKFSFRTKAEQSSSLL